MREWLHRGLVYLAEMMDVSKADSTAAQKVALKDVSRATKKVLKAFLGFSDGVN